MAMLKDSLIAGDLRVTGTIYGDVPLNDLVNADDLKAIEALSGTSGLLKKTAANTWTLDTNAYTTSSGVTSVRVQATSPVVSSVNTAQSSSLNTTISLADNYGDTKNPYASKTARYVLAAPASAAGVPSFRALTNADVGLGKVENTKLSTWTGSSKITTIGTLSSGTVPWARLSDVPTASTSTAGIIQIGTDASNAAAGNHTHTTSIATDTGTTGVVALTSGGTFKLTSGGTSVLFKMPTSTNNAGTITGVTGSDGLTGSGTSGSVTIKHAAPSTSPAKTTSAVYPITIDKYGHITAAGTAVTIPAAVSVKGDAETSYRTGQVNLTPANLGISATTSSVTVGSTTFSKYSHPTGDGNKHVPATGTTNNNKFLKAGSTAGSLSWTTIASVSNEVLTIVS